MRRREGTGGAIGRPGGRRLDSGIRRIELARRAPIHGNDPDVAPRVYATGDDRQPFAVG
ncbi:MAG TPA: hypothetical protein VMH81_28610 [Bryobacteraceae bacterium]|nr:hypothetical protein [Bryobacteraceae bacterium]